MVAVNNISSSVFLLSTVNDTNISETNLKTVYGIYNTSWLLGQYEFSSADSSSLYNIAIQNPADAGDAVYAAQVMLGLKVDLFGGNITRLAQPEGDDSVTDDNKLSVYPNPTSSLTNVVISITEGETGIIRMVDLQGRTVAVESVASSGYFIFDVSGLSAGIYFVELLINGAAIETRKIQVVRE